MANPSVRLSASRAVGPGVSNAVTLAGTPANGELILYVIAWNETPPFATPSVAGFTRVASTTAADWNPLYIFGKIANNEGANPTYTCTFSSPAPDGGSIAAVLVVQGAATSLPTNTASVHKTSGSTAFSIPALTTTKGGSLDLVAVTQDGNNPGGVSNFASWGASLVEVIDAAISDGYAVLGVAAATRATAGPQAATTVTSAVNDKNVALRVEVAPPTTAPPEQHTTSFEVVAYPRAEATVTTNRRSAADVSAQADIEATAQSARFAAVETVALADAEAEATTQRSAAFDVAAQAGTEATAATQRSAQVDVAATAEVQAEAESARSVSTIVEALAEAEATASTHRVTSFEVAAYAIAEATVSANETHIASFEVAAYPRTETTVTTARATVVDVAAEADVNAEAATARFASFEVAALAGIEATATQNEVHVTSFDTVVALAGIEAAVTTQRRASPEVMALAGTEATARTERRPIVALNAPARVDATVRTARYTRFDVAAFPRFEVVVHRQGRYPGAVAVRHTPAGYAVLAVRRTGRGLLRHRAVGNVALEVRQEEVA